MSETGDGNIYCFGNQYCVQCPTTVLQPKSPARTRYDDSHRRWPLSLSLFDPVSPSSPSILCGVTLSITNIDGHEWCAHVVTLPQAVIRLIFFTWLSLPARLPAFCSPLPPPPPPLRMPPLFSYSKKHSIKCNISYGVWLHWRGRGMGTGLWGGCTATPNYILE